MQALRIDWEYQSPIAMMSHAVHFDGVIAAGIVRQARADNLDGSEKMNPTTAEDFEALTKDLPLEKETFEDGSWVWKSSICFMTPQTGGVHQQIIYSREVSRDMIYADQLGVLGRLKKDGTIVDNSDTFNLDSARGSAKAEMTAVRSVIVRGGSAWVVGDIHGIREALNCVDSVGKKGARGFSQLRPIDGHGYFRISPDIRARHLWQLRNLPQQMKPDQSKEVMDLAQDEDYAVNVPAFTWRQHRIALRSPYWQPDRMGFECIPMPGSLRSTSAD